MTPDMNGRKKSGITGVSSDLRVLYTMACSEEREREIKGRKKSGIMGVSSDLKVLYTMACPDERERHQWGVGGDS